jgi:hypothetical protein
MKKTLDAEVAVYYAQVAEALRDLPAAQRADLLEDLMPHLREVAAEGAELDLRLGAPTAYADELRAAAGLPPAAAPTSEVAQHLRREVRELANHAGRAVAGLLGFGSVERLLGAIRPAWWLARGYVAGMIVTGAVFGWHDGIVPRAELINGATPGGAIFVGCVVVLAAMVGSVRIGRIATGWPLERRLALWVLDVVLLGVALATLHNADVAARLSHELYGK